MITSRYVLPQWESIQNTLGYSQAVRAQGDLLHIAGTAALDADFEVLHPGDMAAQMADAYERLSQTLEAHGLGFADLVRLVIYATDMPALLDAVRAGGTDPFLGDGPYPAITAVAVPALTHPGLVIQIEATAAFGE